MARGYSVGSTGADGIFGANTLRALQAFERANNLPVRYDYQVGAEVARLLGLDFSTWQGVTPPPPRSNGSTAPTTPGAAALAAALIVGGPAGALAYGPAVASGLLRKVGETVDAAGNRIEEYANAAGNRFRRLLVNGVDALVPDAGALQWLKTLGIIATSLIAIGPLLGIGVFALVLLIYMSDE
jgi:peptidoglycan hydrolase-like protein with peptidoglycan-binding domain